MVIFFNIFKITDLKFWTILSEKLFKNSGCVFRVADKKPTE